VANILVINSSAAREDSISRILVDEMVSRLMEVDADAVVVHRDLGADPSGGYCRTDRTVSHVNWGS
jgi:FMN-dependent NADH-azoreductase